MVSAINVRENLIDRMEVAISNYLIKMTDQELGDDESHAVTELLNFVTEFERIGDYAVNIMEKAQELDREGGLLLRGRPKRAGVAGRGHGPDSGPDHRRL